MNKIILIPVSMCLFFSATLSAAVYDRSEYMQITSQVTKGFQPTEEDEKMFTLDSKNVEIALENSGTLNAAMWRDLTKGGSQAGAALETVDTIVNIADKSWRILKDGTPEVNANLKYATAVPGGVKSWTQLSGWNRPVFKTYTTAYKNLLGMDVIKYKLMVRYTANGSYNGKGKYLTAVGMELLEHTLLWGFNLSVEASVPDATIINIGTPKDPVASLSLIARIRVWSPIKSHAITDTFLIEGNGNFEYKGVR